MALAIGTGVEELDQGRVGDREDPRHAVGEPPHHPGIRRLRGQEALHRDRALDALRQHRGPEKHFGHRADGHPANDPVAAHAAPGERGPSYHGPPTRGQPLPPGECTTDLRNGQAGEGPKPAGSQGIDRIGPV